jgi:hypothetical protein
VSKNIEDYESCPHSFSFSRPSHHSGKCPWCKRNVLPIIPPPPTPQQPTEASPSAEAMEAADKLWQEWYEKFSDNYPKESLTQLDIARALDAHFAREFARRVEEAEATADDLEWIEGEVGMSAPAWDCIKAIDIINAAWKRLALRVSLIRRMSPNPPRAGERDEMDRETDTKVSTKMRPELWRVLRLCNQGEPYRGCNGRSAHGGRVRQLQALARRGLIKSPDDTCVTDTGRAALRALGGEGGKR